MKQAVVAVRATTEMSYPCCIFGVFRVPPRLRREGKEGQETGEKPDTRSNQKLWRIPKLMLKVSRSSSTLPVKAPLGARRCDETTKARA